MTDGPLFKGASFTGFVALSIMVCFLWSCGCGTLVSYAQGVTLVVRTFFTGDECVLLLQQRIAPK